MTEKEILAEAYNVAENLDFDTVSNLIKTDIDVPPPSKLFNI